MFVIKRMEDSPFIKPYVGIGTDLNDRIENSIYTYSFVYYSQRDNIPY